MALEIPVYVLVFWSCSCDNDEGTFQQLLLLLFLKRLRAT